MATFGVCSLFKRHAVLLKRFQGVSFVEEACFCEAFRGMASSGGKQCCYEAPGRIAWEMKGSAWTDLLLIPVLPPAASAGGELNPKGQHFLRTIKNSG